MKVPILRVRKETGEVIGIPAIKGDKGDKGDSGSDGLTPYIGANGNWWIGDRDTGVGASGGSPGADLSNYYTKAEVDTAITSAISSAITNAIEGSY